MEIDEVRERIADLKVKLAELGTKKKEAESQVRPSKENVKQLEQDLLDARNKAITLFAVIEDFRVRVLNANRDVQTLESHAYDLVMAKKIQDWMDKQRDFWDVLKDRTTVAQTDANSGLVGCEVTIQPEEFAKAVKREIDQPRSFGEFAIFTRQAIGQYKEALLEIAKIDAQGLRADLTLKKMPQAIIDRYLSDGLCEQRWNR